MQMKDRELSQNFIKVDKDRFDFLMYAYFGAEENPYIAASIRAYRDLCRTLRFYGGSGFEYRKYIDNLLEIRINDLLKVSIKSQEQYDDWHHALCDEMVAYYKTTGVEFNMGHAQKWVNMTFKYLYIHGGVDISGVSDFLHIPLDIYVFSVVEAELLISRPCNAWSKIADYSVYIEYQKEIRKKIDILPLRWEFSHWTAEAMRS